MSTSLFSAPGRIEWGRVLHKQVCGVGNQVFWTFKFEMFLLGILRIFIVSILQREKMRPIEAKNLPDTI